MSRLIDADKIDFNEVLLVQVNLHKTQEMRHKC